MASIKDPPEQPEPELEDLFDGLSVSLDYLAQYSRGKVKGMLLANVRWVYKCWLEDPASEHGRFVVDKACQLWKALIRRMNIVFDDLSAEAAATPCIIKPIKKSNVAGPAAIINSIVESPTPIEIAAIKAHVKEFERSGKCVDGMPFYSP